MRNNLIFNLQTRTGATWGAAAALVAMGAGAPGIEGLSSGTKRIEEARTNSMGGLTSGGRRWQRPDFEGQPRQRGLDSRDDGA
jgi:hypothetical protein